MLLFGKKSFFWNLIFRVLELIISKFGLGFRCGFLAWPQRNQEFVAIKFYFIPKKLRKTLEFASWIFHHVQFSSTIKFFFLSFILGKFHVAIFSSFKYFQSAVSYRKKVPLLQWWPFSQLSNSRVFWNFKSSLVQLWIRVFADWTIPQSGEENILQNLLIKKLKF